MKKVEFIASATFMFCDKKDQRVSVWVDGEPFGELHHDDGEMVSSHLRKRLRR